MPAFMSTRHRAHIAARAVSDDVTTPTTRTRQQHSGNPEGLRWFARSSSEQLASHILTSDACGWMHCQQGSQRQSSIGIDLLSFNRREAEAEAAGGEPTHAISGFRSLRTARAWLHGPIQRRSWRRVRAATRLEAQCVPREPDRSSHHRVILLGWLEQLAQIERRPESAIAQAWSDSIDRTIDDPAGDDVARRPTLSLGAGDATLALLGHKLPSGAWTRAWIVLARNEGAPVDRDHVAARIADAGLIGTTDAHRQRVVKHGLRFVEDLTMEPGDDLS